MTRRTTTTVPRPAAAPGARAAARARGLGLVEMMLALAISAAVLTGVATAIDVSFKAYNFNQENANLMQRARLAIHRITSDIRTTALHQPPPDSQEYRDFVAGKIVTTSEIYLFNDVNMSEVMRYQHDPVNKVLTVVNFAGDEYFIARGIKDFKVKMEPMKSPNAHRTGGQFDLLMRATITLSVISEGGSGNSSGGQTITLSTSVIPRRNVW